MRLAWATDIHLNFLTTVDRRRFLESVNRHSAGVPFITSLRPAQGSETLPSQGECWG